MLRLLLLLTLPSICPESYIANIGIVGRRALMPTTTNLFTIIVVAPSGRANNTFITALVSKAPVSYPPQSNHLAVYISKSIQLSERHKITNRCLQV